jgi:IS30 family transposase
MSVDKVAAEIGSHRSTLFREIKDSQFVDDERRKLNGHHRMIAQRSAVDRRTGRHKLVRFVALRMHVITQLEAECHRNKSPVACNMKEYLSQSARKSITFDRGTELRN